LVDNYAFLEERVGRHFFRTIIDDRLELWRQGVSEDVYRVYLAFPSMTDEGDLALIFEAGSVHIWTLSFSIGPGCIAGLACRVLYIACVQGKGRALPLIRTATKSCRDVSPAAILLAAAEGIATALELNDMVGIGASNQISKNFRSEEEMFKAYDEFWLAAGGRKLPRDMYHLTVPLFSKPIKSVKRNHRSRTVRKREYKKVVTEQVCRAFRDLALNGNPMPHD
jgi:uncharacterized protein VirK/YbjX